MKKGTKYISRRITGTQSLHDNRNTDMVIHLNLALYLSVGNSMTVWNFPCKAAGPSPTSMYLLSAVMGELIWAWVRACASSSVSSFVDGEGTSKDLGRDKELCPRTTKKFVMNI